LHSAIYLSTGLSFNPQAMIKLDQLEVQLTTGELGLKATQLEQLHSTIAKSLEDVTANPLQEGYSLLQDVPGAEVFLVVF
jgi:hypothetical protein